jgi:hypothetical protein
MSSSTHEHGYENYEQRVSPKLAHDILQIMLCHRQSLTVKPSGRSPSFSVLPKLSLMKLSRHSAQKSRLSNCQLLVSRDAPQTQSMEAIKME